MILVGNCIALDFKVEFGNQFGNMGLREQSASLGLLIHLHKKEFILEFALVRGSLYSG